MIMEKVIATTPGKPTKKIKLTAEEVVSLKVRETLYKTERAANEYKDKRLSEYPSVADQLDAIFKGGVAFDDMQARIQAIKDKHPKPNGSNM